MIDVIGICYRFIGPLVQSFVAPRKGLAPIDVNDGPMDGPHGGAHLDDLATKALTVVFGMDADGRIKKGTARSLVEKLGLINGDDDGSGFELVGGPETDVLQVEEIVGRGEEEEEDGPQQRLRRAFMVFDKDGDGFIDAAEVKRVLECLGLAKGWAVGEFERMVEMVDLNFDGRVDFSEFQLMMAEK